MDKTTTATRADIEEVIDVIKDITQIMSDMLVNQDAKIDGLQETVGGLQATLGGLQETVGGLQQSVNGLQDFTHTTEATLNRIENKLDPTIDLVDSHETRLKYVERLQQTTA